ncbi:hypothetical protein DPMN_142118 [Dreissena polymorpha]|uniref:Uncharacterized protein n=1 Tax=Dreissena polymorpha TaxID=45954 RepID=A0A9D4GB19_DREPO|nr:hypothetical protein DPMN_142118 [Dreissena polymorpha]
MEPHISQTREVSYANDDDDDDDDENDDDDHDDHDAAAAPPPPPMLLLLLLMMMMMMMLIMFNITTAFEHRCRSGPLNIRTGVYTCTSNKHNRLQFNPLPLRYVFSRICSPFESYI